MRELSTWWKTLPAADRQPFLAREEDEWRCYVKKGRGPTQKPSRRGRRGASRTPFLAQGRRYMLGPRAAGGTTSRRRGKARRGPGRVTREEWRTPEELDERARAQAARRVAKEEEAAMAARH